MNLYVEFKFLKLKSKMNILKNFYQTEAKLIKGIDFRMDFLNILIQRREITIVGAISLANRS